MDSLDGPLKEILNWSRDILGEDLQKIVHLRGIAECQLAYYPAGDAQSRYERHRDAFPLDDLDDCEQRRLTAILYLNPQDWKEVNGGELELHERRPVGIRLLQPLGGRLVVFFSGAIDHAVRLCHRERFALTLWWK
jgi:Rps23 Pro-64 3,4-dihydroxylase Tpa1-like proline 4-hydroxylase